MKTLKGCLLVLGVAVLFSTSVQAGIADGLIAYYPFDGNANDISGSENHGLEEGGISYIEGSIGQAISLDGLDDIVFIKDDVSLDNDYSFTLSIWINPSRYGDSTGAIEAYFISKWYSSPYIGDYLVGINQEGILEFVVADSSLGYTPDNVVDSEVVPLNSWTHVVATFDNGEMKLYKNGILVAQKTSTVVMHTELNEYVYDDLYIGTLWKGNYEFQGALDDFRSYNRAISADEVDHLFRLGSSPSLYVDPSDYNYGEVEVGSPSSMILTIDNVGGGTVTITNIAMKYNISGEPFTFIAPPLPLKIEGGSPVEVEVSYSPSFLLANQNNILVIQSDDPQKSSIEVLLRGRGTLAEEPSSAVEAILSFIDFAAKQGNLEGYGPGNSADKKLNALKNMIESAGDLIDSGQTLKACQQLDSIYKKIDGIEKPKDFVIGEATSGVASGVTRIMNVLLCE